MSRKKTPIIWLSAALLALTLGSCELLPSNSSGTGPASSEQTSEKSSEPSSQVTSETTSEHTSETTSEATSEVSSDISSEVSSETSSEPSSEQSSESSSEVIPVLSRIAITHPANKLEFEIDDEADYTGLEVTAYFTPSGSNVVPTSDLVFSGFSSATAGTKTITIEYTYDGVTKNTSYDITVSEPVSPIVTLDFYGFNDVHGNVLDTSLGVGIAKMSTFLKEKTADQNALLISSGDMWQGSLESNSNRGALMTSWMKYLDFTSMTIGNHEFDWGTDSIVNISNNYDLPILGINVIDKNTGKIADYVTPSTVVTRGGAKIGIIGAIGDCYTSISYSKVMDVEFVLDKSGDTSYPLSQLIKAESTRLREEEGCDFIVYSFHGDSNTGDTFYNDELSRDGYVDVVFEGHTHNETVRQDSGGVYHFQSSASGSISINHFTVELNTFSDDYSLTFDDDEDVYWMNESAKYDLAEDPGTVALINAYDFSQYYQPLGYNSVYRSGTELKQLCADLYFDRGVAKWPSYADQIVLGGGYISVRGEGHLSIGDVTYAQLYNLFPFDNDLVLTKIKGSTLKSNFLNTTNSNYFMKYSSYGSNLRNDQSLVNDNDLYYVLIDTYGYDWLLQNNHNPIIVEAFNSTGYYARDFMADYATDGGFDERDPSAVITHAGTIDDPLTVTEALIEAEKVSVSSSNPEGARYVYCTGVVSREATRVGNSGDLGNVYIKDPANDNEILIYFLRRYYGANNNPSDNFTSTDDLQIGDELLIYGRAFTYGGTTKEFASGTYCITINGVTQSAS